MTKIVIVIFTYLNFFLLWKLFTTHKAYLKNLQKLGIVKIIREAEINVLTVLKLSSLDLGFNFRLQEWGFLIVWRQPLD